MKNNILFLISFIFSLSGFSQCSVGLSEVYLKIHTDGSGNQGYWQLVPDGNSCGVGTIISGGNPAVGCNGGGTFTNPPGGYANNIVVYTDSVCLTTGSSYNIKYVDNYGDGGFRFDVFVNGYQIESFHGMSPYSTYTFTVQEPFQYDLSVVSAYLDLYLSPGEYQLPIVLFNPSKDTVNNYDLIYSVNGGAPEVQPVSASTFLPFDHEHITHSMPINFATNGFYTVKIWASDLNGNEDENHSNDTLTKLIEVGAGRPNIMDSYVNSLVDIQQIAGAIDLIETPTDLDFFPTLSTNQLWITNKGTENTGGSTVTIDNAGEANQYSFYLQDGNAWHFMSLPTGLAFSPNGNWATSTGVFDANHTGFAPFTGPTLWSSDLTIYAQPSGGNGSHIDMLHESPYCQGITSEKDNVFWVFDGHSKDLVRYDFNEDHGPGNDDHSDGIVRRYSDDDVKKDPDNVVVSHLVLDNNKQWLYVVDHFNNRVIRIDINTGTVSGNPSFPAPEPLAEYTRYTGYTQQTVVTGLNGPAGIDVIQNRMIVSEFASGDIIIYDISSMPAVELERIPTGKSSVQGITIGPDGKIWFVDQNTNGVYRIESTGLGIEEQAINYSIYPNPTNGMLHLQFNTIVQGEISVTDLKGNQLSTHALNSNSMQLDLNYSPGVYFVTVIAPNQTFETKRIILK